MTRRTNYCDILKHAFDIGDIVSSICLLIHLYKFFANDKKQSLASKNLASYCLGTALTYMSALALRATAPVIHDHMDKFEDKMIIIFWCCSCNSAFLLLNIMLDSFLGLRRVANKSPAPLDESNDDTFIVFTIFSWGIPLVMLASRFTLGHAFVKVTCMFSISIVYFACSILFFVSLYYMRRARTNNKGVNYRDTISNATINVRLILVIGMTYIIWFLIYFTVVFVFNDNGFKSGGWQGFLPVSSGNSRTIDERYNHCYWQSTTYSALLPPFEGVFVLFTFTLKKDTFEDIGLGNEVTNDTNENIDSKISQLSCPENKAA